MTKRKQAQAIANLEGKKSQARFADIMEILTIQEKLVAIEFANTHRSEILWGVQQRASRIADKLMKGKPRAIAKAKPKRPKRKSKAGKK